ncbi:MAG: TIGR03915 family putative DNA repair protein [Deltaproteobacteria bacterium]|jgi:probable DNA metabolism protein|nr:TIGR03915 family putative DNA repair protein [Deltaproteobacteria bacterium]
MLAFRYPRTFEGLLSAVFDAYKLRSFPEMLLEEGEIAPLTAGACHRVEHTAEKSGRVFAALQKKLSRQGLQKAMLVWLSEEAGSDFLLFSYIRRIIDAAQLLELDLTDPLVLDVNLLARKVACERSKLLGFVRFQKTAEGVYFAVIAPRHNVLSLLLAHFADRFAAERWLIYDLKRRCGVFHQAGRFHSAELDAPALRELEKSGRLPVGRLAADEALLQEVWRSYFKSIAIQERRNPELQRRLMPRRYWKYLTEAPNGF